MATYDPQTKTFTLEDEVNYVLVEGDGDANVIGNDENNTITGNAGNNILNGGLGDDTLEGGLGDDTYYVDSNQDILIEEPGEDSGHDIVYASVSFGLQSHTGRANIEDLILTGAADIEGVGNALDNRIVGNEGKNQLWGFDGDDILEGGEGADTLDGGNDNDTLDGGAGDDYLWGGAGDDTYYLDSAGDQALEQPDSGNDTVIVGYSVVGILYLHPNIENLVLTSAGTVIGTSVANSLTGSTGDDYFNGGAGDDTLNGGDGGDILSGGDNNDTIIGGDGDDTLQGGSGDDVYYVDTLDRIGELDGAGFDKAYTSTGFNLRAQGARYVEELYLIGTANIDGTGADLAEKIVGNDGNNTLDGLEGDDTLDGGKGADVLKGGAGADSLVGGEGDDTYVIDANDTLVEAEGEGRDTVQVGFDGYTLLANFEDLTLTGSANISGTGNGVGNFIRGNAGNNTLIGLEGDDSLMGGAGADRMEGGAGSDLYWVDNAGDVVVDSGPGFDRVLASVSYTLAANIEYLAFEGSGNFVGTGNELDNTMYGNTGANTLDGGAGRDQLDGGEGNDMLMGGAGDDTITDWMGDDVLDGGAGKDDLRGGVGNDTYYVDALDIVTELAGQGLDTVIASESFALGALAEIEVLLAQAGTAAINLTGNEIANTITGNDGANQLSGQGGDDILNGGAGNDTMSGGLGSDVLTGGVGNDTYFVDALDTVTELAGQGTDTVTASESFTLGASVEIEVLLTEAGASAINLTGNDIANTVTGNDGVNQLSGQGGNDILNGGLGNDILSGGKGKDRFVFDSRPDAKLNLDRILDFKAKDDTIALENAVFVKLGKKAGALKASMFYAGKKAHDKDDRVIYDKKTGSLYYDADGTGKSKAVKFATVKKGTFIDHHDFLVI